MATEAPTISSDLFKNILNDDQLTQADDLQIFRTMYYMSRHEGTATDIAKVLGYADKAAVVGKIVGLSLRIVKKYGIERRVKDNGKAANWDLFFTGYDKEAFFVWQLKPELIQALEELSLVDITTKISIQNSYLFAWNPDKWKWEDLENNIEELQNKGTITLRWSCRSHKSIRIGDRAFLVRLGDIPRGIMASGYVVSEPFLSPHWSGEEKDVPRVLIEFDVILNPNKEPILTLDLLKTGNLTKQHWTPQASGISIQTDCVEELEATWFEFLTTQNIRVNPFTVSADTPQIFIEGTANQITQTRYERNPYARIACLEHYGFTCSVCTFNFVSRYGKLGSNFIHVHHLTQVATIGKAYTVDPINDLRPVCPNCHAMLHRRNPPLTIDELSSLLK